MSSLRSSSSPARPKAETASNVAHPIDLSLSSRRPSWSPEVAIEDHHVPHSQSSKLRSRLAGENSPLSPEWTGTVSSLLKRRRSSFAPSLPENFKRARKPRMELEESPEVVKPSVSGESISPEEGKSLRSSWEINVKDLVGDAVGNMSISPASRDIVLAARRGLFIIDLESPFSIPRFLPQGGTWDVADVQWNPHPSRAEYIVSTSSEKLLIWNLLVSGKTSIQHILKSHYRAITDINWHTTECDVVVSTGIDSWVWAWDLRTPEKPIFGLSAFNAGGTQVKWNYQDPNILASSHSNEVLIWDRRKGSLPITQIPAHSSKIYGIDWSRSCRNEIVTCSLDKSIKTWDINASTDNGAPEPKSCIHTNYPVWRARNLPFGEGILSLPQRGETTLEMYAKTDGPRLVETFEGHADVVKEFVWRKGSKDDFQLITWSKDRTLRFWPIDVQVMQKVGHVPELVRGRSKVPRTEIENELHGTFRTPLALDDNATEYFPVLSAPIGNRSILAEVRAPRSSLLSVTAAAAQQHLTLDKARDPRPTFTGAPSSSSAKNSSSSTSVARSTGGTMSKGGMGLKSIVQVDQLAWLSSVRVASKRGSSSGGGSQGEDSGASSRLQSMSRAPSGPDRSLSETTRSRHSSSSLGRALEERISKEGENNQSLQDEITSVLTMFSASSFKISLEKHDLSKKRTCTLGLHGPWGEGATPVFLRITFNFPRDYPQASYPHGTPTVELDRNPLIPQQTRTRIMNRLRHIRERNRPCLEACLRLLLLGRDTPTEETPEDSDSSSDDDKVQSRKKDRAVTVSILKYHKNLAEPRTSQGAFGPNGELICFFGAPRRLGIVRNVLRATADSEDGMEEPSPVIPEPPTPPPFDEQQPSTPAAIPQAQLTSYFQSPALVSDAVRRLGLAATDRIMRPIDPTQPEAGLNILRAMSNLLTVPQQKMRRGSDSKYSAAVRKNVAMLQARRSTIFVTSTVNIAGADKKAAEDYVFMAGSLLEVCGVNADAAKKRGRYDHERIFRTLRTLFKEPEEGRKKDGQSSFTSDPLAKKIITRLYSELSKEKDIQMLAMIAMIVLQTEHVAVEPPNINRKKEGSPIPPIPLRSGYDYFSLTKSLVLAHNPVSPNWPRLPSPNVPPHTPSVSSSNSSRGSWTSLFNTGTVRQLMGMQDSFKEGMSMTGEAMHTHAGADMSPRSTMSATTTGVGARQQDSADLASRRARMRKDSWKYPAVPVSRSWNEGVAVDPLRPVLSSFSSGGHRQGSLRFADASAFIQERRSVVFEPPVLEETEEPLFDALTIQQFRLNVYMYCELLFRWQMYNKRLELLKAVNQRGVLLSDPSKNEVHRIGLHRICTRSDCKMLLPEKALVCPQCHTFCSLPTCTICRLPVKGLSRTCLTCSHVTHISCSKAFEVTVPICPSGCGCFCTGTDGPFTRPSTRMGLTPPLSEMALAELT